MTLGYEKAVENTYGFRDKFKDLFLSFFEGERLRLKLFTYLENLWHLTIILFNWVGSTTN